MMTRALSRTLFALAVLLAAGTGAAQPAFTPAETLEFECRYLGLSVGRARMLVGAPTEVAGERVWPVMGSARTESLFRLYPLKDRFVTWWNPETGRTLGHEFVAEENGSRRRERVRYDRETGTAVNLREIDGGPPTEASYAVDAQAQDLMAAMLALRNRPLAVGDRVEIPVFTGKKTFTLQAEVEGKAQVEVEAGRFDALVVRLGTEFSGKLAQAKLRVYLSDDARHVPVRLDGEFGFGKFSADLARYQKGISDP